MEKILIPFKKIWAAWKKTSLFFKLMVPYSIVLIIAVIVVCVWEWDALKEYQADYNARYEEAEEKAAKGNTACIEEYVAQYTKELHKELVVKEVKEDNPYYTDEELVDYKLQSIDFDNISYKQNEKNYTDLKPVYDILAGEQVIATVTLGAGSIDEFGFNTWKVNGVSVDGTIEYPASIKLSIENGMSVMVGDVAVTDDSLTETTTITENIYDRIFELSGEEEKIMKYTLSGVLNAEDIKVVDASDKEVSYIEEDGVRVYKEQPSAEDVEWCTAAADRVTQAYVKYTNKWISMAEMLNYTVSGSAAASAVKRSESSVSFARKPSTIDYTSKVVDNIHVISSSLFYCDVSYEIEKKVSGKPTTETIMFTLILRKKGDVWQLDDMAFNG